MSKFFKVFLTIIFFIFSLHYTNKIIEYFQKKDPLMQEIIKRQNNYYQAPIDAIITNNVIIPEVNGIKINVKKSYQKMKKLNIFNESLLVYDNILPKISYLNHYDKIIIPRNNHNLSIVFDIDNNITLFNSINKILKENNVVGNLLNSTLDIKDTNFKNILSTNYSNIIDYCISFTLDINNECKINKKYTVFTKENIINNYYLNNTKKAINKFCLPLWGRTETEGLQTLLFSFLQTSK